MKLTISQIIALHNQVSFPPVHIGWKYHKEAIELIKKNKAELIEAYWLNHKTDAVWGSPNINTEKTYSECIEASLKTNDNNLILEIRLYDGDAFYGMPTGKRCQFDLIIKETTDLIEEMGNRMLSRITQETIDDEDEKAKQLRFDNTMQKIIDNLL